MSLKALIPVRKGSQRVIDKNLKPFAGSSLLEIKIKQLLRISSIDEVCVNSDCEKMLNTAESLGATPISRDPYFASSEVPMNEVWKNLAESMQCESILYTNVTNPLIEDRTYEEIIGAWNELNSATKNRYDSITTVHEVLEYLWNENGPVNYDPLIHPRSQDLPKYYGLNFAVSIIPRDMMVQRKSIIGANFKSHYLDRVESLDIDDEYDFKIAELIFKERKHV
jgi:CMP-N,N'-diacetyllegionaminic acid synthase